MTEPRTLPLDTHPQLRAAIIACELHLQAIEQHWSLTSRAATRMTLAPGAGIGLYNFDLAPTIGQEFFEQFAMLLGRVYRGHGDQLMAAVYRTAFLAILNVSERYESILRTLVADLPQYRCYECGEYMWEHSSKGPCQRVGCFCQSFTPGREE